MKITNEIKQEVQEITDAFNKKNKSTFMVRYRKNFLYIDKVDKRWFRETITHVGRLEFDGDMEGWDFAVYKYSSERYDPEEFFFPGNSELDGTIEGALRASLELY